MITQTEEELELKRRLIMGIDKTDDKAKSDDSVLLPVAAGVLPSVVATVLGKTRKSVNKIVKENKERLMELCSLLTVEYQEVNLNMLFDDAVSRLRDIVNDDATAAPSVIAAAREVLKMIKEGDAKKSLNNEIMNSTYEDVPQNVSEMERKIAEINQKKKDLGLL